MASPARRVSGHLRTVGHLLSNLLRPPPPPPAERWRGRLEDPEAGPVEVSGWLARAGGGASLVVLVHGLGGSADSPYLCHAARVAHGLGLDTLRLNLRGADPAAGDFYHGGLTAELHAAVADRALAGYRRIAVLGYSMGGHVALRYAAEVEDPRVTVVGAVCSPLHLGAGFGGLRPAQPPALPLLGAAPPAALLPRARAGRRHAADARARSVQGPVLSPLGRAHRRAAVRLRRR